MTEDQATYARRWLLEQVGYHEANRRINAEARALRVDALSITATRHAIATYHAETGKSPRDYSPNTETLQEGLIP